MSVMYTDASVYGSNILLREIRDGIHSNIKVPFQPTLFLKAEDGDYTGLYGEKLKSINPGSIRDCKDFVDQYKGVSGFEIFGQLNYSLNYLNTYHVQDWKYSLVRAFSIDIETKQPEEGGFPKPENAAGVINAITIQNLHTEQCFTWGLGPTPPKAHTYTKYTECKSEEFLLRNFVDVWEQFSPELCTGWNSNTFDFPYLINRIRKICGEETVRRLSPWKIVTSNTREYQGKLENEFNIVGVQCLDYLDLMKKFTYGGRESWKLDAVAQEELGEEKLKNPAETFEEFYTNHFDIFIEYNVHDNRLVTKLDKKMKLIELAMTIAYKAKINFSDVYSPVKIWDAIIANRLMEDKVVVPQRKSTGGNAFGIEGAYVKTPQPGFYNLVSSLDATSLYPSLMLTLNISPETFLGMVDSTVDKCLSGQYENDNPNIAMGANGAIFDKTKQGIIPKLIIEYMAGRKAAKKQMLGKEQEREDFKKSGEDYSALDSEISALNNLQMAYKILMNSLYGGMANAGFRFFNSDMAESITTTGQLYLRSIEQGIDKLIDKEFKMIGNNSYMVYADTDSVYFTLEKIINRYAPKASDEQKLIMLEKLTADKLVPLVNQITDSVSKSINAYQNAITFKQEIAADKAIWIGKKNYVCRVHSSEGVRYAKPKYKTMGIALVRSSTPKLVQDDLRDSLEIIFNGGEKATQQFIQKVKSKFMTYPATGVARPSSANNIENFSSPRSIYKSGADGTTPIHIRGSLLYNHHIKEMDLTSKYDFIRDGDKVKYIYLSRPNPIRENVIAWPGDIDLPKELGLDKYIDWDLQFEKTFQDAIKNLIEPIGWSVEEQSSLEDFF